MLPLALMLALQVPAPLRYGDVTPVVDAIIDYTSALPVMRPPANKKVADVPLIIDLDDLGAMFRRFTHEGDSLVGRPKRFGSSAPWKVQLECEKRRSACAASRLSLLVRFMDVRATDTAGEYRLMMAMTYVGPSSPQWRTVLVGEYIVRKDLGRWRVVRLASFGVAN